MKCSLLHPVKTAIEAGATVRLCFDPIIYTKEFDEYYGALMDIVISEIDFSKVRDVSIGSFRVSKDYLKNKTITVVYYSVD
mgnify:CR=1 FL=1